MNPLRPEQIEYAVTFLRDLVEQKELKQTDLERCSGVAQSEISKILRQEKTPSVEQLRKLSQAMSFKLSEILHEIEEIPDEILGYLATPLTAVVADRSKEDSLISVVKKLRGIASADEFKEPRFNLYWPGRLYTSGQPQTQAGQAGLHHRSLSRLAFRFHNPVLRRSHIRFLRNPEAFKRHQPILGIFPVGRCRQRF